MGKINLGLDIPTKTWFLEVDKKFTANCNRCKKQLNKSGGFYYCKELEQFWCNKCCYGVFTQLRAYLEKAKEKEDKKIKWD